METTDAIYFYGLNDEFSYMSNFYKVTFTENNIKYNCSEQYFMYYKCLMFEPDNEQLLNEILNTNSATVVKKLGRQVKNYDETKWNQHRYDIMKKALILKFTQNFNIKEKLLSTKPKQLYEASKYDKIWGIGYYAEDAIKTDKSKYGSNLLGKCLMEVRELI